MSLLSSQAVVHHHLVAESRTSLNKGSSCLFQVKHVGQNFISLCDKKCRMYTPTFDCFRNFNYRHTSFIRLHIYIFFFLQMGGLWQPCVRHVYWRQFPTAFGTLVFVTFWQFLKYFKLTVFVMVISDF